MCGIFGYFFPNEDGNENFSKILEQGIKRLAHRGPDASGQWINDSKNVGFGHTRLSIIDLVSGDQPMHSPCGRYTIIFNGEIYNFESIKPDIGVSEFRTLSDTEVILLGYRKWGPKILDRLEGMYAFAIWDNEKEEIFIARDRFGIKPLYYTQKNDCFYFASELKALLEFSDRRIDTGALREYFTFQFCLEGNSLIQDISQLPPAHFALINRNGKIQQHRYWDVNYNIDFQHTEKWFIESLRELLHSSVLAHLKSDVEVGAYISGGVDSSLIAALARGQSSNQDFKGFNGRFAEDSFYDESFYAERLAAANGIDIKIVDITEDDFVNNISDVIWHLDSPAGGPGSLPQYMVSKEASKHLKVVCGGQGGDEIFGGYTRYLVAYFEQCILGAIDGTLNSGDFLVTYNSIIPNLQTLQNYKPMLRDFFSNGLFEPRERRYWQLINRSRNYAGIVDDQFLPSEQTYDSFEKIFTGGNTGNGSYFDLMSHFDFKTLLPALLQVEDRMSMAHGLEARVPLLDHKLIEFAATIPADIKFKNGELKRLLKLAFSDSLPDEIIRRKDKMGFPVPLNDWLKKKGVARDWIGDLFSSENAQTRHYLIDRLDVDKIVQGQGGFGRNIWALISLELWHQQFIDVV